MSLEQQVTALVASANALTGAVNGKIGDIDQEMVAAKQSFENFKDSADGRYYSGESKSIRVDGDTDTFYPVLFALSGKTVPSSPESNVSGRIHYFHLLKYVHDKSTGDGAFRFMLDVSTNGWGGYTSYLEPVAHDYTQKPFLGNYRYASFGYYIVFWLRGGGRTYNYQSSWGVEPVVLMERTNTMTLSHGSPAAEAYPDWLEPDTVVNAGLVASGFRR